MGLSLEQMRHATPPPQITSVCVHLCIRILRPRQNHCQTKPTRKFRTASGKHCSQRESRASTEFSGAAAACAGPQPWPPGTVYNQLEPADLKITGGGRSPWLPWSPARSQKSVEVCLLRVTTKAVGCLVRVGPSSGVAWAMDFLTEVTPHGDREQIEGKEDPSALSPKPHYKERKPGADSISYPMGSVPFLYFSQFPKKDSIPKSQ